MEDNQTYTKALRELEGILNKLRSGDCDIDTLADQTRRAAELLVYCRERLTTTEAELSKILEQLSEVSGE